MKTILWFSILKLQKRLKITTEKLRATPQNTIYLKHKKSIKPYNLHKLKILVLYYPKTQRKGLTLSNNTKNTITNLSKRYKLLLSN